jgi:cytochrome c551
MVAVVLAGVLMLTACGAKQDAEPVGQVTQPEAVYKQSCISCHGADLQGISGPNLQKIGAKLDAAAIEAIIRNGKGAMPSMARGLSDEQIGALATWLAAKK